VPSRAWTVSIARRARKIAQTAIPVGVFPLAADSADAAFVITLPPGVYSAVASGANSATGIAMVEICVVE